MSSKTNIDQNTASISNLRSSSKSKSIGSDVQKDVSLDELEPEQSTQLFVEKKRSKKIWKDPSEQSSHTKFYKRPRRLEEFKHVTRDEYLSISESMSGSADTYSCIHGPEGKKYTQKGLLKRNILKNLDPIRFGKVLANFILINVTFNSNIVECYDGQSNTKLFDQLRLILLRTALPK